MSGALSALLVFACLMGVERPGPPLPVHARWADVALALALALAGLAWLSRRLRAPPALPLGLALGYLGWSCVASASSDAPTLARVAWPLGIAALVGCFAATAVLASDERVRDQLLCAWIGGAVVLGAVGVLGGVAAQLGHPIPGLLVGEGELGLALRPAGLTTHGLLAQISLVPLLVAVKDGERLLGRRRRAAVIVLLALVLVLGLTRTVVAAALGLVFLAARRRLARGLALALAVATLFVAMRIDVHGGPLPGIRWRIAARALETAVAHPLLGVGPIAPVALEPRFSDIELIQGWDAHSTLLDVSARAGVPAGLLFAAFFVVVAVRLRRAEGAPAAALLVGLYATALDSLSVDLEDFRHVWLLLGLAAAGEVQRARGA